MQMTTEQAERIEQRNAENIEYRRLRDVEAKLSAIVTQADKRFELDGLAAAYNAQTGGDLKAELTDILGKVPRLAKRFSNSATFTCTLLSDSVFGRQWSI